MEFDSSFCHDSCASPPSFGGSSILPSVESGERVAKKHSWQCCEKLSKKEKLVLFNIGKNSLQSFSLARTHKMRFCLEIKCLPIWPQRNLAPETHYPWKAWLQGKSHSRNSVRGKEEDTQAKTLDSSLFDVECCFPKSVLLRKGSPFVWVPLSKGNTAHYFSIS